MGRLVSRHVSRHVSRQLAACARRCLPRGLWLLTHGPASAAACPAWRMGPP